VQTEAEEPEVFRLSEEKQLLFYSVYMGGFACSTTLRASE
jgi:hypothetical protein